MQSLRLPRVNTNERETPLLLPMLFCCLEECWNVVTCRNAMPLASFSTKFREKQARLMINKQRSAIYCIFRFYILKHRIKNNKDMNAQNITSEKTDPIGFKKMILCHKITRSIVLHDQKMTRSLINDQWSLIDHISQDHYIINDHTYLIINIIWSS